MQPPVPEMTVATRVHVHVALHVRTCVALVLE